jgi:hypothetical protein
MGAPMDDMFTQAQAKYKDVPKTQGPNLNPQQQQPLSQPSVLDRLTSFFKGSSAPQQAAPQSPQTQSSGLPSQDAVQAEIARRKAAQVGSQ